VDLFDTRDNAKMPIFVSPYPDPQAWEVDAFKILVSWEGLDAYAGIQVPLRSERPIPACMAAGKARLIK